MMTCVFMPAISSGLVETIKYCNDLQSHHKMLKMVHRQLIKNTETLRNELNECNFIHTASPDAKYLFGSNNVTYASTKCSLIGTKWNLVRIENGKKFKVYLCTECLFDYRDAATDKHSCNY